MEEGKSTEWDTGGKYRSAQSIIGLAWHFGFFEALKSICSELCSHREKFVLL